jgi:uncharacterized protein
MNTAQNVQRTPRYANTGYGPSFSVLEIGMPDRVAVIEPDTAFWVLVHRDEVGSALSGGLVESFSRNRADFTSEMHTLRSGLKPSAVYFNPTEQCNFNCTYCYLPEDMRRNGKTMSAEELCSALERLEQYFSSTLPEGARPQLIFHGSEPMVAKESVFEGIRRFGDRFSFGVQTNASLLDDEAISFLKEHRVGIGISLDAPTADVADLTRKNWAGTGYFAQVVKVMEKLASYEGFNVITTVTSLNVATLPAMVDFYHDHGIRSVMFNPVRCTREGGMELKPENDLMSHYFLAALDRTYELFEKTGRKLVVANFANVLAGIVGPTGRRLMCDISPCGGGRCFVAVSAHGDVFPCSEFIGFPEYRGGNLYRDALPDIIGTAPFLEIINRRAEDFKPCSDCSIRHFCGAPCPAEVKAVSGTVNAPSPYCEFYEEQVRYAFRVIANGREETYLWDGWQEETEESFTFS